ncbi:MULTISPECIES: FIST signal transduction protein [Roseateles]|uniref:FIST N-terminal domain-containing protein n=1 Tax=Roseateles albus TaxID=2987525 RepID=A0ABT5KFN0_9BURK|nr:MULTISPECIES: FIST N-terminal domain-containing protein [Roseateles]MCV2358412.1 FIST C-terminal domain-containing protein [Paucibacter sp. TC2R-5]MDC8772259.1 FIST N-terminal domain-containing protein [Roseateles albus]
MKVAQITLREQDDIDGALAAWSASLPAPSLVLAFSAIPLLKRLSPAIAAQFPTALRMGCSTAGEISSAGVGDDSCVLTALRFENAGSHALQASTKLADMADSEAAGRRLAEQLPQAGLRAVLLLGQGVAVNGSALIAGMTAVLGHGVTITGGLAGDAAAFKETWVLNQSGVHTDQLVCVGLYGEALVFAHGSFGGWAPFGPARRVTRCAGNVLFELDGEPALDVYKRYLGDYARDLPASGLLFPFAMLGSDHNEIGLIRTILAVDESVGSLTLAGDIDPDGYLKLMHASTDALVGGAESAAQAAAAAAAMAAQGEGQGLGILVSCVGRKLVMGGRVEEEIEAVADVFGRSVVLTGFYSNGEISPFTGNLECKLHNQTMTITYLGERL